MDFLEFIKLNVLETIARKKPYSSDCHLNVYNGLIIVPYIFLSQLYFAAQQFYITHGWLAPVLLPMGDNRKVMNFG